MYIRSECGQRWWRPRSWKNPKFRKLEHFGVPIGWAFGPVMVFKKGVSC